MWVLIMKLNKETTLAATLFFLGVSALSIIFVSAYQLLFPYDQTVLGFAAILYLASVLLTGVFALLSFYYHMKGKKK